MCATARNRADAAPATAAAAAAAPRPARRPADRDAAAGARRTRRRICATRSTSSRPRWTARRRRRSSHRRPPPRRPPAAADHRVAGPPPRAEAQLPPRRSTGSGCAAGSYAAVAVLVAAADRHVRDGLLHRRRAQARRHPHQPGVDDPGQRRQELAKIVPPEGNRVDVNIDQIPVHVRNAVMAAEDRDFYSNPGFSFTGFARAFKNNIFGGDLQGGSTITQQYVKNALVGDARSGVGGLVRKAKELVISTKMSRRVVQRPSAAGVSEHHLLRPRRLRHLGGVQGVLRQAGRAAHRRRGRAAGRADPAAVRPGSRRRSRGCRGAVELGARRHGRHRRAVAARPCRAGVPADGAAGSGARAEPDHRARTG